MKRRELLRSGLLSSLSVFAFARVAQAEDVMCVKGLTPKQVEGPFYPIVDQLDKDSDLINLKGSSHQAIGEVVIIEGLVTDQNCVPVKNALVEIWQACHTGKYNHAADPNPAELDPNFQYWGKAITDEKGFYRFRTIIPGAYPADTDWERPPHIHFKISALRHRELITQMYFAGQALNDKDLILQDLSATDQDKVVVAFKNRADQQHPVGQFNIQIRKLTK
ncbi:MAG: protocatechuate 3,4-dioxygenase [Bdellovibrionota bacterium]